MAGTALCATDEKANFNRLTRLLVCGGITLLREVFDSIYPPANLSVTLNNPVTKKHLQQLRDHKKVITQQEWKILYPSPGMCGKSTDFDITLLFKLFRNICGLAPPVTGWDTLPNTTDHSLEVDLVRIKFYRNKVYGHSNDMEISDVEFGGFWREISEALLRIAHSISSAKKDEWEKAINKFLSEPLTPDADQNITELKSWYKKDLDTKDEMEKLTNEMKEMKIKEEQRNILLEQLNLKQEQSNTMLEPRNITLMEQLRIMQDQMNIKLQEQSNTMLAQMINIVINPESYKPGGSSSISPGHLPSDPQLQEAGVQTQRECVIPIPMEHPQAEGATSQSTGELQTNQQNPPANLDFWYVLYSFKEPIILLLRYLRIKLGVDIQDNRLGSLVITVSCSSLEVLDGLWRDYCSGHLNKVVQETLVTEQLLKELCLSEVKLKTIISEKEYNACKEWFIRRSDIVSQPSCLESSTSEASTDTTVSPTTGDTDEGEHSEYQGEGMKGTRQSETEESPKKGPTTSDSDKGTEHSELEAAADVGTTTSDSDESEHSDNEEDDTKETGLPTETKSSPEKVENVIMSVSPHFSSGLLSLESFVQIVDETPHDISVAAAQRMMPNLIGHVNEAHEAFQIAETIIQEINDKLDNERLDIVVQEKNTDGSLRQTEEDLAKLEERGKVLQEERSELERQLSSEETNLRRDLERLEEKKAKLDKEERERVPKTVLYTLAGALFLGGVGAVAAGVVTNEVLKKDVENAEKAVSEASDHLTRTRNRIDDKKSELSNLADEKEKQRENHKAKSKELEMLKLRKTEIKTSQVRLARLNESIKSCAMLVGTTTTRANMMAIEANNKLPDIEAMMFPLKAIAGDLSDASLSNSRLLSGNVDMQGIRCKIKMITSKALKAITRGDMDEWA